VEAFVSFLRVLYLAGMRWEGEDKLWWVFSKRGLFVVKSFYSVMGYYDSFRLFVSLEKVFGGLSFR
jgi:hypothetical protein